MARILIGVSGGIAAYKAVELARLATQAGHGVRVTMTDAAARFVGAATFEGITGAPVLVDEFSRDPLRGTYPGDELPAHDPISHLAVVERADAFVVAPASANTLAKLAAGICDSLLTTSFLACTAPRIVAPAMNGRMWEAAATGANVATLRERGIEVMEPGEGALASRGEHGRGRMPEPEEILTAIEAAIGANPAESAAPANPADLAGRRVLVTAGGTREQIDPVRFVGNRSSGRMGVALAEAAARRGAEVTLIAANVALPVAAGVERVDVTSAAELEDATAKAFGGADLLLMAAAVADFRPADPNPGKLAREEGSGLTIELEPTADVLAGLAGSRRNGQVLVGFAAEHGGDFVARARGKLERKGIDAIVVNDVSDSAIGFESRDNEVTIVSTAGEERLPRGSKRDLADAILDRVAALR
ncbi:MAG TPA: bifunctional phosphopantothenoylcysteine decarboxylase/phosphopantothenate--cysteine ligase CoaBC [Solirubrobacterales bacterium]|nr:bifunctional phosphopantothenoylcysteine decarboxylase/phosphopantothenate--cysteine ligase CoaBC [Solirubrobacterales bacterium]